MASLAASSYYLVVKFADSGRVRVSNGNSVATAAGTSASAIQGALTSHGLNLTPEISNDGAGLDAYLAECESTTGIAQSDLRGMYRVTFPTTSGSARQAAVNGLLALSSVEYVSVMSTTVVPPSPTPQLESAQTYFQPTPGVDVAFAESLGLRGEGMKYVDIETCWLLGHEDQLGQRPTPELGQTPPRFDQFPDDIYNPCYHGAGSVGIISATPNNGFGVKGMATAAQPFVFPEQSTQAAPPGSEFGLRRPAAITEASRKVGVGDVLMLEMQDLRSIHEDHSFRPAEVEQPVHEATVSAVNCGRIVVAAAGNGNSENLDGPNYVDYRNMGDSGALIVGAGSRMNHSYNNLSTWGSRVNVQGWDAGVATLGYGDLFRGNNDHERSYTGVYSGTSAATAMVSGVVILLQQAAKLEFGSPLEALEIRQLLRATGIPQLQHPLGPLYTPNIGPLPNLRNAINRLDEADAVLTGAASASSSFTLSVGNLGPSRLVGRTLTVRSFSGGVTTTSPIGLAASVCALVPWQAKWGECTGSCSAYECAVPEVRIGDAPIALQWSCESSYTPTYSVSAGVSESPQSDPVGSNNLKTLQGTCGNFQ